jgi:hypothetical protein
MQLGLLARDHVEPVGKLARNGGSIGARIDKEPVWTRPGNPDGDRHALILVVLESNILGLGGLVDICEPRDRLEFGGPDLGGKGGSSREKDRSERKTRWPHHNLPSGPITPHRLSVQLTYRRTLQLRRRKHSNYIAEIAPNSGLPFRFERQRTGKTLKILMHEWG